MDCGKRSNISVSLELSLSTPGTESGGVKHQGFENGECSSKQENPNPNPNAKPKTKVGDLSLELSLGCSSISGGVISCWPLACKASRSKVKMKKRNSNGIVSEDEDPWTIKKKLCGSDVGRLCRLSIGPKVVESHIFPFWNANQLSKIGEGLPVSMWDCDTNTQHGLNFKQWNKMTNGFIKNRSKGFVRRRGLKVGDQIGLYWDSDNSRFNFSLLNRAAQYKQE